MKTSSKKPAKKVDVPPKKVPVKMASPIEQEQLQNIKSFAMLVKELLERGSVKIISAKNHKEPNSFVLSASKYIKLLDSINCKISLHHDLYREMYLEHRSRILKCKGNEDWMNRLDATVNIHLGKGTAYEKEKVILKVSVACSTALKYKKEIDTAHYDNVNDKEEAKGRYEYQYLPLFYFRLLTVIKDALGGSHSDIPELTKLVEYYYSKSGLMKGSSSSSDEEGATEGISKMFNGLGEGKGNIDSKGVQKVIEKVTSNPDVFQSISSAMKDFSSPENKNKDQGEIFADMARTVGPQMASLFNNVIGGQKEEEESSSEESDSSE